MAGAASHRAVIVEDHAMVLEGLAAVLDRDDRLEVVGTATSLDAFRRSLDRWRPDVVLTDYQLPDGEGSEVPTIVLEAGLDVPVVMMSGLDDASIFDRAVASGCAAFVDKAARASQLAGAVVRVADGATLLPGGAVGRPAATRSAPGGDLTEREVEVFQLLANGNTAEEIATALAISVNTARNHIRSILSKCHARSQLQAVVFGLRAGLVTLDRRSD